MALMQWLMISDVAIDEFDVIDGSGAMIDGSDVMIDDF
jgi:hypothetical protein